MMLPDHKRGKVSRPRLPAASPPAPLVACVASGGAHLAGDSHPAGHHSFHNADSPDACRSSNDLHLDGQPLPKRPPHQLPHSTTTARSSGDSHPAGQPLLQDTSRPVPVLPTDVPVGTVIAGYGSDGAFLYEGRWHAGVAGATPVFLPPDDFLIPQPQLWTRCACHRHCVRCVYDGEVFCDGCRDAAITIGDEIPTCDCEPGCCGVLSDWSDGSDADSDVSTPTCDCCEACVIYSQMRAQRAATSGRRGSNEQPRVSDLRGGAS